MCVNRLQKPEEGTGSPWDCSYRWLAALMWALGTKPLPLQGQLVFLTTEPSLRPPSLAPLRGDSRYSFICGSRTWKKVLWIRTSVVREKVPTVDLPGCPVHVHVLVAGSTLLADRCPHASE